MIRGLQARILKQLSEIPFLFWLLQFYGCKIGPTALIRWPLCSIWIHFLSFYCLNLHFVWFSLLFPIIIGQFLDRIFEFIIKVSKFPHFVRWAISFTRIAQVGVPAQWLGTFPLRLGNLMKAQRAPPWPVLIGSSIGRFHYLVGLFGCFGLWFCPPNW